MKPGVRPLKEDFRSPFPKVSTNACFTFALRYNGGNFRGGPARILEYARPYKSRAELLFRAGLPAFAIAVVTALLIVGQGLPALRTLALWMAEWTGPGAERPGSTGHGN